MIVSLCSELFTNCLDMLCTLLHSLPSEFHTSLVTAGEEGKKAYVICVKKLKSELNGAKSYCVGEIQQLFPLAQEAYTVTTVKQPDSLNRKTFNTFTERIKVEVLCIVCVCVCIYVCMCT